MNHEDAFELAASSQQPGCSSENEVVVKIQTQGEDALRRFRVFKGQTTWEEFRTQCLNAFAGHSPRILWTDEDGDVITLANADDLQEALSSIAAGSVLRLQLVASESLQEPQGRAANMEMKVSAIAFLLNVGKEEARQVLDDAFNRDPNALSALREARARAFETYGVDGAWKWAAIMGKGKGKGKGKDGKGKDGKGKGKWCREKTKGHGGAKLLAKLTGMEFREAACVYEDAKNGDEAAQAKIGAALEASDLSISDDEKGVKKKKLVKMFQLLASGDIAGFKEIQTLLLKDHMEKKHKCDGNNWAEAGFEFCKHGFGMGKGKGKGKGKGEGKGGRGRGQFGESYHLGRVLAKVTGFDDHAVPVVDAAKVGDENAQAKVGAALEAADLIVEDDDCEDMFSLQERGALKMLRLLASGDLHGFNETKAQLLEGSDKAKGWANVYAQGQGRREPGTEGQAAGSDAPEPKPHSMENIVLETAQRHLNCAALGQMMDVEC